MNTVQLLKQKLFKKAFPAKKSVISTIKFTNASMSGSIVIQICSEELQLQNKLRLLKTFS